MQTLKKKFVLQQDQSDCGVACLSSIIKYYEGVEVSLEKLRELSGTSKHGTTLLGLYDAANKLNFTVEGFGTDTETLKSIESPVIIHATVHNTLESYLVCYKFMDGYFIIGDPSRGIIKYSPEDLDKIWRSKVLLQLTPNEDFLKNIGPSSNKKSWLLNLVKDDYSMLIVALVLGVLVALISLSTAVFTQKLIDDLLPSGNLTKLFLGLGLLTFLLICKVGLSFLRSYFLIRQGKEFNNRVINNFYRSLLRLPKFFFDTRTIGDLVAQMNDTSRIQNTISQIIANVITNILIAIASIGLLFYYYAPMGIVALFGVPLFLVVAWSFNSRTINAQKSTLVAHAQNESNYIDTIQGIETIKVSNRENLFSGVMKSVYEFFQDEVFNLGKINMQFKMLCEFIGVGLLVGMISWSSYLIHSKHLTLGEMMAIMILLGNMIQTLVGLTSTNIQFQEAKIVFERMFNLVSIEPEYIPQVEQSELITQGFLTNVDGYQNSKSAQEVSMIKFSRLNVKNLEFNFKGETALLKNISFEIKKGQIVALLGDTGSGKSTIIQILQKFQEFSNGGIEVNDLNWNNIGIYEWRQIIATVPQKIKLFNRTLIENIHLGDLTKVQDTTGFDREEAVRADVISFCKRIGFDKYFEQLPKGYMTLLGEGGVNISGGQQQLVAFARALYQRPQLLLLDEATSAMDKNTEAFILEVLKSARAEMGILMVTHRSQFANFADRVYSIQDGQIA